jgi:hypothetical protein
MEGNDNYTGNYGAQTSGGGGGGGGGDYDDDDDDVAVSVLERRIRELEATNDALVADDNNDDEVEFEYRSDHGPSGSRRGEFGAGAGHSSFSGHQRLAPWLEPYRHEFEPTRHHRSSSSGGGNSCGKNDDHDDDNYCDAADRPSVDPLAEEMREILHDLRRLARDRVDLEDAFRGTMHADAAARQQQPSIRDRLNESVTRWERGLARVAGGDAGQRSRHHQVYHGNSSGHSSGFECTEVPLDEGPDAAANVSVRVSLESNASAGGHGGGWAAFRGAGPTATHDQPSVYTASSAAPKYPGVRELDLSNFQMESLLRARK